MRHTVLPRLLACACLLVAATGCKTLSHAASTPPTKAAIAVGDTGTAAPIHLAVKVKGGQATITWSPADIGAVPAAYELTLDAGRAVRLTASTHTHLVRGLTPGPHVIRVVAVSAHGRSAPAEASFLIPVAPQPLATAEPAARAPGRSAVPTGKLVIDSWHRLPDNLQTHYGCDRIVITVSNRSTGVIAAETVAFATTWYAEGFGPPPLHDGRQVTVTQRTAVPVGARKNLTFDVCLPEKKTRNVFGEPTGIAWIWVS